MSAATLTDFLLARIAEDEARFGPQPWTDPCGGQEEFAAEAVNRVLAECEAKRQIVDLATTYAAVVSERRDGGTVMLSATLRLLALPYADHPDYREEWRP